MPLIPITLPSGMYRNGTPYDAKGRYEDGNLVRWHNNSLRPVGGWQRRTSIATGLPIDPPVVDPETETIRDALAWRDNAGDVWTIFGSNSKLYVMSKAGTITDVTPAGFTGGANDVVYEVGYGTGFYGLNTYGTPRNAADVEPVQVLRWTFDMWGENVICTYEGGNIYEFKPNTTQAVIIANAPITVQSAIVTNERIVMTIRNDGTDMRIVEWSDREDNSVWVPETTNYAGKQVLSGVGKSVGIYSVQSEYLILTETNAHVARYVGAPYVYGFTEVGDDCGPLTWKSALATERFVIWLGFRNFWMYDGTLKMLPCDVMDYLAEDVDYGSLSKMWTTTISSYSEAWWFYQSTSSDDVDSYVMFDYAENTWATGRLSRTAGLDRGALESPVMVDETGAIWNHEQGTIIPNGEVFARTGPLELGSGDSLMAVRQVFPDTQLPNGVELHFYSRQYPTGEDYKTGPYAYANPIHTTGVMGRELRMEVRGLTNTWEVGSKMRFNVQPLGQKGYPTR